MPSESCCLPAHYIDTITPTSSPGVAPWSSVMRFGLWNWYCSVRKALWDWRKRKVEKSHSASEPSPLAPPVYPPYRLLPNSVWGRGCHNAKRSNKEQCLGLRQTVSGIHLTKACTKYSLACVLFLRRLLPCLQKKNPLKWSNMIRKEKVLKKIHALFSSNDLINFVTYLLTIKSYFLKQL